MNISAIFSHCAKYIPELLTYALFQLFKSASSN